MNPFHAAALAIIDGELETLRSLLASHPALSSARAPTHGATLLHYVSANGPVEDEMQRTPPNAVAIAGCLIENGVEVDATIDGRPSTTALVGLVTSGFPAEAGVQGALVRTFLEGGAAVDGLEDDGYPLSCALCFQRPAAVEALVQGGARIDNVVAAAALGQLDSLRGCFDGEGVLYPTAALAYPDPFMRTLSAAEVLETAVAAARSFGQDRTLEYLEGKRV